MRTLEELPLQWQQPEALHWGAPNSEQVPGPPACSACTTSGAPGPTSGLVGVGGGQASWPRLGPTRPAARPLRRCVDAQGRTQGGVQRQTARVAVPVPTPACGWRQRAPGPTWTRPLWRRGTCLRPRRSRPLCWAAEARTCLLTRMAVRPCLLPRLSLCRWTWPWPRSAGSVRRSAATATSVSCQPSSPQVGTLLRAPPVGPVSCLAGWRAPLLSRSLPSPPSSHTLSSLAPRASTPVPTAVALPAPVVSLATTELQGIAHRHTVRNCGQQGEDVSAVVGSGPLCSPCPLLCVPREMGIDGIFQLCLPQSRSQPSEG